MVICAFTVQDYYNLLYLPKTIKSVGKQRQSWSSASFQRLQCLSTETITVFFAFKRQSSPLACGENHGHPLSLFSRLLQSSLPSKDNQVCWHVETIMVIRFRCFQDYYSLLCLPKTIKFVGMQRQSWSSAFIVSRTIIVCSFVETIMVICTSTFPRLSSPLTRSDNHGLLSSFTFRR